MKAEERAVQKLLSFADTIEFEGYQTMAVNTILYYSQTAAAMYLDLGFPLGLTWSYRGSNKIHVSLRSDGTTVDCAQLAKKYGGGGHKGAAGFIIDFNGSFPWKRLEKDHETTVMYDTREPVSPKRSGGEPITAKP